ncbi:hypothetical protein [Hespellia stercorisuis]|uniref:Uncharacterized protein n=1 Tax=Hespellia stercorisuis DSM 15480 TaxID=1121950 RepID=A0A1M6MU80_9FIRM|nr:hypothetical protein [Hespellia stercorisuis]SHJ87017.1 hypothetical protein SAMN02745243_01596 [Hespellia stercorisuis DSM 15480]
MDRNQVDKLVIAYIDSCETERQIEEWFDVSGESNFLRNIKNAIIETLISGVAENDQYQLSCLLGDGDTDGVYEIIRKQPAESTRESADEPTEMKRYKLEFAGEAVVMAKNEREAEFKLQRGYTEDKFIEVNMCYESDEEAGE